MPIPLATFMFGAGAFLVGTFAPEIVPEWVQSAGFWGGLVLMLIGAALFFGDYRSRRDGPNMSMRDAYRYLMLDSKWSLGRKVDPYEQSASSNSSGGRLYGAINDELYDVLNKDRLKVWSGSKEIPEGRWKKDLRLDLTTIMGRDDSAVVSDCRTNPSTQHYDVAVDKKQFLKLWPKATFFERRKDKKLRSYREMFYDREYQNGNR